MSDVKTPNPEGSGALSREAILRELHRQNALELKKAREEQGDPEESGAHALQGEVGTIVLWTFLGVGYYLLAMGAAYLLMVMFRSILPLLGRFSSLSLLVAPALAYRIAVSRMDPLKQAAERKGLKSAIVIVYAFGCLAPTIFVGNFLSGLTHH